MLNLEELTLFLSVIRTKSTYIDGNQLDDQVLKYMPRLNKLIFNQMNDIRKRGIQSIDVCSDNKFINNRANCHVYSLPYQFNDFFVYE